MKKVIALIVSSVMLIGAVCTLAACQSAEVTGVDIYMMQLVCEELNMKMEVKDVDFDGIVGKVKSEDNAVGAAGITITEERKAEVAFSDAYYNSVQCIISKSAENYSSLESLAGKKIGVQKGTTGALLVADAIDKGVLKNTGASVLEYDTGAVAKTAMMQDKCDYIVIDELPAQKLVLDWDGYVINDCEEAENEKYGYCVSKNASKKTEILAAMNKVISEANMEDIVAYYTALSSGETTTVTLDFPDLSDNTNGTLIVYTCSGFEPYEFIVNA